MNNEVILNEKDILAYIKDAIKSCNYGKLSMQQGLFHHNTNYKSLLSVIKYGLLSIEGLRNHGVYNISEDTLKLADDELSHINGKNGISLSKVGLTDLYRDEFEYNPLNPQYVDIQIDDVTARRNSEHYGNEFIAMDSIGNDKFKCIDTRLLELCKLYENNSLRNYNSQDLINNLNSLIESANYLKQNNLYIPIRDTSFNEENIIDIDKIANTSKISCKSL